MNSGQLIDYNMRSIFLEKQCTECVLKCHAENVVEKLVPNSFFKNMNLAYLWINSVKFHAFSLYRMSRTTIIN